MKIPYHRRSPFRAISELNYYRKEGVLVVHATEPGTDINDAAVQTVELWKYIPRFSAVLIRLEFNQKIMPVPRGLTAVSVVNNFEKQAGVPENSFVRSYVREKTRTMMDSLER